MTLFLLSIEMREKVERKSMKTSGNCPHPESDIGTTPAFSAVAGIFEKIDEKIEYAYGRRDLFAEDRRYWDGYIDGLEAAKRIIKELEDEYWKEEEAWSLFYGDRKEEEVVEEC